MIQFFIKYNDRNIAGRSDKKDWGENDD